MDKLKRLLCYIGLHKWSYTAPVYMSLDLERLAIPSKEATRTCNCCNKRQVRDEHCFGLNPPKYMYTWY